MVKNFGLFGFFKFNLIFKLYELYFYGYGYGLEGIEYVFEFLECFILLCIFYIILDIVCIIFLLFEFCRFCSDDIVLLLFFIIFLLVLLNDDMYSVLVVVIFLFLCFLEFFNMEISMGIFLCRLI